MLAHGTTTVEIKSGYGLSVEDELKSLWAVRDLSLERQRLGIGPRIAATFLGAHAVPEEFANDPDGYVSLVVEKMLPTVAQEGLGRVVRRLLRHRRVHRRADPPHPQCRHRPRAGSAPPRQRVRPCGRDRGRGGDEGCVGRSPAGDGARRISRRSERQAQSLCSFQARLSASAWGTTHPPALLSTRVCLSPLRPTATPAPAHVRTSAAHLARLLADEDVTRRSYSRRHHQLAYALDRGHILGSLEPGKLADIVVWDVPNHRHLAYHFGVNLVEEVYVGGRETSSLEDDY